MPKSLGQIHSTNFNYEVLSGAIGEDQAFLCDNSAALSTQFNRNIRMMQSYKWVGTDLVLQLPDNLSPSGNDSTVVQVKGRMRYFAPTKGRCQALRDAYSQFRQMAKNQSVNPSKNRLFDFRVIPRPGSEYPVNALETKNNLKNLTTLDNSTALCMTGGTTGVSVFDSYNVGVNPEDTLPTAADFASGLETWQSGTQTDFVLNEGLIQSGNPNKADTAMEEIPFVLTYDSVDHNSYSLQWRPDPALYVSVLGGFIEIVLDEITASGATGTGALNGVEIDITHHWAGWKSIVRPPKMNFGRRSRSAKRMRAAGSQLTQKNIKDVLALLAMAKKLK